MDTSFSSSLLGRHFESQANSGISPFAIFFQPKYINLCLPIRAKPRACHKYIYHSCWWYHNPSGSLPGSGALGRNLTVSPGAAKGIGTKAAHGIADSEPNQGQANVTTVGRVVDTPAHDEGPQGAQRDDPILKGKAFRKGTATRRGVDESLKATWFGRVE